jgi:hypothetical protein
VEGPPDKGSVPIDTWLSRPTEQLSRFAAAGYGALAAARACEGLGEVTDVRRCRELAVEFLREAETTGDPVTSHGLPGAQLLADTLRRLGRFEEARRCCHRGLSVRSADPVRSLLEYEIELISQENTAAHSADEVGGGGGP